MIIKFFIKLRCSIGFKHVQAFNILWVRFRQSEDGSAACGAPTLNTWGRSCSGCSFPGWLFSSLCIASSGSIGSGGSGEFVIKISSISSSGSSSKSSRSSDLKDNWKPRVRNDRTLSTDRNFVLSHLVEIQTKITSKCHTCINGYNITYLKCLSV